jgi:hypothetical protein
VYHLAKVAFSLDTLLYMIVDLIMDLIILVPVQRDSIGIPILLPVLPVEVHPLITVEL